MKKLLTLLFSLVCIASYAQVNTFGGIGLRVNDTTTYQTNASAYHTAGYYDIYFNNQATNNHWDVWNGSDYDHVFSFEQVLAASESLAGKIEIATQAETDAGTDDERAITALKLNTWNKLKAVVITSNVATTSTSLSDVTGLQFPVSENRHYYFRFVVSFSSSATTNGSQWAINGPALTTLNYYQIFPVTTATMSYQPTLSAYDTSTPSGNTGSTTANILIMEGVIVCSASGNVVARLATESGGTITALAFSHVQFIQLD